MLAAFILLTAVVSAISPMLALWSYSRQEWRLLVVLQRMALTLAFTLCLLVSGITLLIGRGGGLYWLPAAYVIGIVMASTNAWLLLVEVQRGIPERAAPGKKVAKAAIRSGTGRNRRRAANGRAR